MSLGERLLSARAAAGLSQQEVTDATGIPRMAVSNIEQGKRKVGALELKALAELFGTTWDALLDAQAVAPSVRTPDGLMVRLETVTENLHGYLADRARELAEPHIRLAEEAAARRVQEAEREVQRQQDLVAELRRQLNAALRDGEHARHVAGLRHNSGECPDCALVRQAGEHLAGADKGAST